MTSSPLGGIWKVPSDAAWRVVGRTFVMTASETLTPSVKGMPRTSTVTDASIWLARARRSLRRSAQAGPGQPTAASVSEPLVNPPLPEALPAEKDIVDVASRSTERRP
jgi:hypothetical protein